MKKILVLVQNYPNNYGGVALMYVHTRNLSYVNNDIEVTVLNFSTKESYDYEGIHVISEKDFKKSNNSYDVLVSHAPNIRNHYRFLKKYGSKFARIIFFFHGHEVLNVNKVYSEPYFYIKRNKIRELVQFIYDRLKLKIWHNYLPNVVYKSDFIFVSEWMKYEFFKWTKIEPNQLMNKTHVIYNSVGKIFEVERYDQSIKKEYDFITIRSNLDGSKYSIDIVNNIAKNTPNAKFLVIGKGEFFKYFNKSQNLTWLNTTLNHNQIIEYLNKSRYAFMPTRCDAQGLMMCEMAAFGIPVITSDIDVCHEVFDGFENAFFINNDSTYNLDELCSSHIDSIKDRRFFESNTVREEEKIIQG